MESTLSCFLCLCAILIPVIQVGAQFLEVRMPDGHSEHVDTADDMTVRHLRNVVAERAGKKDKIKTIVLRYAGQLLPDGDDALLADFGVFAESVVEASVEDYQQMLLGDYKVPTDASYRRIFDESIRSYPEVEEKKIDLVVRLLLQNDVDDAMYKHVMGVIYNHAFLAREDLSLFAHFLDEFPDLTRESLKYHKTAGVETGNGYAFAFYALFWKERTGITLKLIEQLYDVFEEEDRDINGEYVECTPLEYVLEADDTWFACGDEGREEIVRFLRSKGAVDRRPSVRRLIDFQEKEAKRTYKWNK